MPIRRKKYTKRYSQTNFYSCTCPICQAMKKAEDEGRNLNEKELLGSFKLANKPRKMIKLNYSINDFLKSQKNKSKRVYDSYVSGLDALETYFSNYDGFSTNGKTSGVDISTIPTGAVDYLLSFFIIRKYLCADSFYTNTAKVVASFFKFLVKEGLYDEKDGDEIQKLAVHYGKEYSRILKISRYLWDFVEHDTDNLMKLSGTPKYETRLTELKNEAKKYSISEVGYVEISKVENGKAFGTRKDNGKNFGPVEIDPESAKLILSGDIINMISVRKQKEGDCYEICELGNVYPRYFK